MVDQPVYKSSGPPDAGGASAQAPSAPPAGDWENIDGQQVLGTRYTDGSFRTLDGSALKLPDGVVQHGRTLSDGSFQTPQTIDGAQLWGSNTKDGGWMSAGDAPVYVPKGGSAKDAVHGIYGPDGSFLANGEVRTIEGRTVYGSQLSDHTFLSQDGTQKQLLDGSVEHGRLTADGYFQTPRTIGGKELWGSDTNDGGWMADGSTYYIPKGGSVKDAIPGIPAPDGSFLANGEVRTIEGRTVYGSQLSDHTFLSQDGSERQLLDGSVEHGRLTADGYFQTPRTIGGKELWGSDTNDGGWMAEGSTYYIPKGKFEKDAIPGIPAPDGSFLANGEVRTIDGKTIYGSVLSDGSFVSQDNSLMQLPNGTVKQVRLMPDGSFQSPRTVPDGRTLWGYDTKDGGWYSEDKTVLITKDGKVMIGRLNDDGTFQTQRKLPDGRTLWGTDTQDGGWISEDKGDQTVLITKDGKVMIGRLTADGNFQTSRVVDGKTLWGSDTQNGGWMSEDGTVYFPPGSTTPQHGITAPDGSFLKDGVVKKLPNGQSIYGYMTGKDFYSYDGKTIILADGTVITGNLDEKSGLFTANDGKVYFVSDNGIQTAVKQADGSYLLGDGTTLMTPEAWAVDLPQLHDCIQLVKRCRDAIADQFDKIKTSLKTMEAAWVSPAGKTVADVNSETVTTVKGLSDLLDDMLIRMQKAYDNYVATEQGNVGNFSK